MSKNSDLLSLNDFLYFIKNNFIIVLIFTIIFSLIGFYFNSSLNSKNNLSEDKFIDIKFIYQDNEIGYLMNYVDSLFNNSSVNVNFHHMFLDVVDKPGIGKSSVIEQIKNVSEKNSESLESKFSKINHIKFIYQNILSNSSINQYLRDNKIKFNNLAIQHDKTSDSISVKFITANEINKTTVTEITNILNDIGFEEIEKAIKAKILYHDNLIKNIITDLEIITEINKDSFYKSLHSELKKLNFLLIFYQIQIIYKIKVLRKLLIV